jgi:hypothetical protein
MPKIQYFILLSNEGDFLKKLDEDMWKSVYYYDDATIFETYEEAIFYLSDMSIRSIWPQAKVESILV